MEIIKTILDGVVEIRPAVHGDHRGWFSESYNAARFAEADLPDEWVQDNESLSATVGTVRGLHFQVGGAAQHKLVRVIQGAIVDVAVDLRQSSPTFGRHVAVELSAATRNQVLVPIGFGHGFCTIEPDTVVCYKVSTPYNPDAERAVRWDDPALAISWPVAADQAVVSGKDAVAPLFADAADLFD